MSNESLEVGDLVLIIRTPCCPHVPDSDLGTIQRIEATDSAGGYCTHCNSQGPVETLYLFIGRGGFPSWGRPRSCLKKIPPLSELEGSTTKTTHKEPA